MTNLPMSKADDSSLKNFRPKSEFKGSKRFKETEKLYPNFLRHYYDVYQLLDVSDVQTFIGTPAYLEHKSKRFKSENQNIIESGAFTPEGNVLRRFEAEYSKTTALYYRGQTP